MTDTPSQHPGHPGAPGVPTQGQVPVGQPTPVGHAPTAAPGHPQGVVPVGPQGPVPGVAPSAAPRAKEIATLPPLPVLRNEAPLSASTGEPVRPVSVVAAMLLLMAAAVGITVAFGIHWWEAAHQDSYATSARIIEWLDPEPGKWLALTLEGVLAAAVALVAGACAVAGFQAWNGWRWSRIAGIVAVALTAGFIAIVNWEALPGAVLALLGAGLLWLPRIGRFFREFETFRATGRAAYRRPERIFYGRLPRFR